MPAAPTSPTTVLKYANLQMAAEARLDLFPDLKSALTYGNNRSSKFTDKQAAQFTADWKVVAHQANTGTGFSGTLFECLSDDPARGLVFGQQVMSFRSTEFADDAARDNEATNVLEVKEFGWAFGQIDDMKKWVDSLHTSGDIVGPLTVTGYSLGGHLATAFNQLYPSLVSATYTFNGAGVGRVTSGNLSQVIAQFDRQRMNVSGNEIRFTDPQAIIFYNQMRARLTGGVAPSQSDITNATLLVGNVEEARLLSNALVRIKMVMDEVARLGSVTDNGSAVGQVPAATIDATKLDYQLAAILAGKSTSGVRTDPVLGGWDAYAGRNPAPGGTVSNFYDIYGANAPSAVSNSQLHYGQATGIFIEDQPLYRGSILLDATIASLSNAEVKLLVNNFSQNDFGDTHSLVLLVDSLSVQDALARLDPNVELATLTSILKSASNAKSQESIAGQGKAEGDVLERVVDALYKMFVTPGAPASDTTDQMNGGTWAKIALRNTFYNRLNEVLTAPAFKSLQGKVSVNASVAGLASQAREDFGALVALLSLSPFSLTGKDAAATTLLASALGSTWVDQFNAWQADKAMTLADRDAGKVTYTDTYLSDRAGMLGWIIQRNLADAEGAISPGPGVQGVHFKDVASSLDFDLGLPDNVVEKRQTLFGGTGADVLTGKNLADRLYGGAGADLLNGLGGADHLEGNAGNDWLNGGAGNDTLLGGAGDDTLDGGAGGLGNVGNDILSGGTGSDTYVVGKDAGVDTLLSSDAADKLVLDGRTLNGSGVLQANTGGTAVWVDRSNPAAVVTYLYDALRSELTVAASGSTVIVKDFQAGDLGIAIPVGLPQTPLVTVDLRDLATEPATTDPRYGYQWYEDFSGTGQTNHFTNFNATGYPVFARAGNDWLEGGTATPVSKTRRYGGSGDDRIYAGTTQTLAEAVAAQEAAAPTGRSDLLLDGGTGNDQVFGGASDDALFGGEGDDTLVGGAGNDVIYSDGDAGTSFLPYGSYSPVAPYGNRWVGGDNQTAATRVAFNAAVYVGYVYYIDPTTGKGMPTQDVWGRGVWNTRSADFAVYGGLVGVRLNAEDFDPPVWSPTYPGADAYFKGTVAEDPLDPAANIYFNTDRSSGRDVVFAGAGNDMVNAGGGNDFVDAGSGDDWIEGRQGDDRIVGGGGNDTLFGDYRSRVADDEKWRGLTVSRSSLDPSIAGNEHGRDFLDGGAGDDWIAGDGNDDTVLGGEGDDTIFGDDQISNDGQLIKDVYAGNDYVDAGDGKDRVFGGAKDDYLAGGKGDDVLYGDNSFTDKTPKPGNVTAAGNDTIDGGEGRDLIWGEGGDDSLSGGLGDDQLIGDGEVAELVSSLHGRDTLDGGAGDDYLMGGGGDDLLMGGDGDDFLSGDDQSTRDDDTILTGNDVLDGGAGADFMLGSGGDDQLSGGTGDDTIFAGTGNDWVDGGDGGDYLEGENGNDTLLGGAGSDTLDGGAGDDVLDGGAGDDVIAAGTGSNVYLWGRGDGIDSINFWSDLTPGKTNAIQLKDGLTASDVSLRFGSNTQGSLEIAVNGTGEVLRIGGFGVDLDPASALNPLQQLRFAGGTVWNTNTMIDQVYAGTTGNDQTTAMRRNNVIHGGGGNDRLIGNFSDDALYGDAGNDTLRGDKGADTLDGGTGTDLLVGGDGSDTYRFGLGYQHDTIDNTVDGARTGVDTIQFGPGIDPSGVVLTRSFDNNLVARLSGTGDELVVLNFFGADTDIGLGITSMRFVNGTIWDLASVMSRVQLGTDDRDDLVGYSGADVLSGDEGVDHLRGHAGADRLNGGAGADLLEGDDGDDVLSGGTQQDVLLGGNGNDTLDGGAGADRLEGGNGSDTYLFGLGMGQDTIVNLDLDAPGIQPDTILFGTGVLPTDVVLRRSFEKLFARIQGTEDELEVQGYFAAQGTSPSAVEFLKFANGTVWNAAEVMAKVLIPTAGADQLYAYAGVGASLFGGDGNDALDGNSAADTLDGGRGQDTLNGLGGADLLRGGASVDHLYGGAGNDSLFGDDGSDRLYGDAGNDLLVGGMDRDYLDGNDGDDTLDGGAGADVLSGGSGADTYLFGRGSGRDWLNDGGIDAAGTYIDTVQLGAGVATTDVSLMRSLNSGALTLAINGTADQLIIERFFDSADAELIRFADGTVWDRAAVLARSSAPVPPINFTGTAGNDVATGGLGDDVLSGYGGNDTLDGAGGDDTLDGGAGSDAFLFGRGSGRDQVQDLPSLANIDTLQFKPGVLPVDVVLRREYGDLIASIVGTNDQVSVANHFNGSAASGYVIDQIRFDNGTVWSTAELQSRVMRPATVDDDYLHGYDANDTLFGLAGDDVIKAGAGNDVIDGGAGSDELDGGDGNDVYLFGRGSGRDIVHAVDDLVLLGAGVAVGDVRLLCSDYSTDLILGIAGTADELTISSYFADPTFGGYGNRIQFANGTVWDAVAIRSRSGGSASDGDDTVRGNASSNVISGLAGDDRLYGYEGNDTLDGGTGADSLGGGDGNDLLNGGRQDDTLDGGVGADQLFGQTGDDVLYGGDGDDSLDGGSGDDDLTGGQGNDTFFFGRGAGHDRIDDSWQGANLGLDRIVFGASVSPDDIAIRYEGVNAGGLLLSIKGTADSLRISGWTDYSQRDPVIDQVVFANGSQWDPATLKALTLTGTDDDDMLWGYDSDDLAFGSAGDDTVSAGAGDDTLVGGDGNDQLSGGDGNDRLDGGAGNDSLYGGSGNDVFVFGHGGGQDTIDATSYGTLEFEPDVTEAEVILRVVYSGGGPSGLQVRIGDSSSVVIQRFAELGSLWDPLNTYNQVQQMRFASGTVWDTVSIQANIGAARLEGTFASDLLVGTASNDRILGGSGVDTLSGGAGNDWLDGGQGDDAMAGGAGNDVFVVDSVNDTIFEAAGGGNDTVRTDASFSLGAELENLVLTGSAASSGTGNASSNRLFGNTGDNVLDGAGGVDVMAGGRGNDFYLVDESNDVVLEQVNEGIDTVQSSASWSMTAQVENLVLTGAALDAVGNALANNITGNALGNRIDGGKGADSLVGRAGDDYYLVDHEADSVTELANEGIDTVEASVSFSLSNGVENLTLALVSDALNATGNTLDNVLLGNLAANRLDGRGGADQMTGLGGDDVYIVDNAGDVVVESVYDGVDRVEASVSCTLSSEVENLTLVGSANSAAVGNALANILIGNLGNNRLDGKAGADTMQGGAGDDVYVIDNAADTATELAGEGNDTIESALTWSLALLANVENLSLTGSASLNATGNALNNVLRGNAGANRIDGGAGVDTMSGGAGNDTFVVDNTADVVTELTAGGSDTVESSATYVLSAELENLTLSGSNNINGSGNATANVLKGNAGANVLDGGAGNDTLIGGMGDDVYKVDATGDVVTEAASAGTDTIQTTVTLAALAANVENLFLLGTAALNGTGNTLNNAITGNSGGNRLDGGAGADTMAGAAGNDTYVVDNALDAVVEAAGGGMDTVEASLTWSLALTPEVENLTLTGIGSINATGNAQVNALLGNAGNNRLDGAAGADKMTGGAGNDTFVVDNAADIVTEAAAGGTDTVESTLTWSLAATPEVENLTLTGIGNVNATGNAAANTLRGNAGNNTLNGGVGIDTMIGGAGDDTYVVDVATDVVTEGAGAGTDTVQSAVTLTLGTNVENLTLTGAGVVDATGNSVANVVIGNSASNVLTGAAGNDTLDGGAGADTLIGGTGADLYAFDAGHGIDTIQENDATLGVKDAVQFLGTIKQADVQFKQVGSNLEVLLTASLDKLVMQNWYLGSQYHVEEFRFSDGNVLLDTQVQLLVSAMAGFNVPTAGIESSPLHRPMHNHMISAHMLSPPMTA